MADNKKILKPPPPPKKLMEYLDGYVIGQELAKKCLSVGVYNHYKKIYHNAKSNECNKNNKSNESVYREATSSSNESDESVSYDEDEDNWKPREDDNKLGSELLDEKTHQLILAKSNILMMGPTGSGKTLLAQTIAKCLDVPFVVCDCTKLTEAGYYGDDVDSVIRQLLLSTNYK